MYCCELHTFHTASDECLMKAGWKHARGCGSVNFQMKDYSFGEIAMVKCSCDPSYTSNPGVLFKVLILLVNDYTHNYMCICVIALTTP